MFLGSAVDKAEGGFFDKFRNKIPGLGLDSETDSSLVEDVSTARAGGSATPRAIPSRQDSSASDASSTSSSSALSFGLAYSRSSKSDSSGRRTQKSLGGSKEDGETSGSEYGLAYADSDSTDYEEDQARKSRLTIKSGRSRNSRNGPTPTPGQRAIGLDRLGERPVSGSVYSDDEDGGDDDLRNRLQLDSSPLTRKKSTSSVSSASSTSSAAAIAKALGLSKSSKERGADGYSSMGGPGAPGVARTPSGKSVNQVGRNRSATVSTQRSTTSDGPGRARSNTDSGSSSNKPGMEQIMNGWMTDGPATPPKRAGIGLRDEGPTSPVSPAYYDSSSSSTRGSKLAHRSNTVGVTTPYSRADAAEKMPKLPARSMTERGGHQKNPSISSSTSGASRKRKVRVCVRCDKRIEDGRWISVEPTGEGPQIGRNGEKVERKDKGVLCERCWKNMYLPKCRRCNLPIEKQAVSSSDGQLKGKYHKDCFNCFTCNKPFPDKIFYVYDGRPLCKYHYHEANDSLCAAATCGQPIEGPCIVSHAGDKYHPEHLTCEWSGYPKCEERLNGEYWELDGRMLCEKHAHSGDLGSDWEDDKWDNNNEGRASRAMKRMTRFVDLGALGDLR
ncbi:hypothetical protein GYMLUDRAFT_74506 [Collybiopsis luxurians FD-317 M1]|uniref:LIM zinc-binding domain-containing protein n=1 Tax=Collybiopsis luxurians FD-317 M1 TaxID=944289 RepID=A0A0D0CUT5_9AGAR|nr:hypothetical protein GYMLUDRAFT_74506 [Collybiopsis luxurians FD-317 M1]